MNKKDDMISKNEWPNIIFLEKDEKDINSNIDSIFNSTKNECW